MRSLLAATGAVALAATAGCGGLRRASPLPIEQVVDFDACPRTQAPVLAVLLPGVGMTPEELLREGFFDAVRRRGLAADLLIAHTQLSHLQDGDVLQRMQREVVAPARARGWSRVWLVGISLGGYLAMQYAREYPGEVEGVFAIAPYLGRPTAVQSVAAAGGAVRWAGTAAARVDDPPDLDRALWRWLAARSSADAAVAGAGAPAAAPGAGPAPAALQLGYGTEDRFADAHRLLAAALPPADVLTEPGGHDWPPWRALWGRWLDRAPWPRVCPA